MPLSGRAPLKFYSMNILKRLFDILGSSFLLVFLFPLLFLIAFLVRIILGSPVFFLQQRPGIHGRPFTIIKFRTMRDEKNNAGDVLPDSERLSRFGRFLRGTSLDELPELINVLKGDMSFVGPRPLLMRYLDRYTAYQARRHEVRPGITGWAQVKGRNAITWEEKFDLDIWYVENQSFWVDMKILFLTVWQVLLRKGVSATGHATMPEFKG